MFVYISIISLFAKRSTSTVTSPSYEIVHCDIIHQHSLPLRYPSLASTSHLTLVDCRKKKKAKKASSDNRRPSSVTPELYCNACQAVVREALKKLRHRKSESDVPSQHLLTSSEYRRSQKLCTGCATRGTSTCMNFLLQRCCKGVKGL